jgi:hypothetical protein
MIEYTESVRIYLEPGPIYRLRAERSYRKGGCNVFLWIEDARTAHELIVCEINSPLEPSLTYPNQSRFYVTQKSELSSVIWPTYLLIVNFIYDWTISAVIRD